MITSQRGEIGSREGGKRLAGGVTQRKKTQINRSRVDEEAYVESMEFGC